MQPATGPAGDRPGQQVVVQMRRIGVRHHDVRIDPLAVGEHHAAGPATLDHDRHDVSTGAHPCTAQHRPLVHRLAQPAQATGDVPGAEGLLDVGDDGQRRRSASRVRAGVGRVAVEEHPQPRVAQLPAAQPAQRLPRRDRAHVGRTPGQAQQVAGTAQRRLEERLAGHLPHLVRPVEQPVPVGAGALAEALVQRHPEPGPGGVGHVQPGDVVAVDGGEPVARHRIDRDQVDAVLEWLAGLDEQVPVDRRQGEEGRPGVEGEAVPAERPELAAPGVGLLAHDDVVAEGRQAGRRGEAGHPRPDHHDPRHVVTLRRSRVRAIRQVRGVELEVCPSRPTT